MSSLHVSARLFDRWQNELHRVCGRFQSAPPRSPLPCRRAMRPALVRMCASVPATWR